MLAYPNLLRGGSFLFSVESQYNHFKIIICGVLKVNKDEFIILYVNVSGPGSHSSRKVAAILCTYGFTVSPPITSIFLHAGWSMVNVKSLYLRYELSSD